MILFTYFTQLVHTWDQTVVWIHSHIIFTSKEIEAEFDHLDRNAKKFREEEILNW